MATLPPSPLRRLIAAVAVALLMLGACSGDDDVSSDDDTDDSTEAASDSEETTEPTDSDAETSESSSEAPESESDDGTDGDGDPAPVGDYVLSGNGLGELIVGQGERQATGTGLVEPWGAGCPLGDDGDRVAELSAPLEGSAHAFDNFIYAISVTDGPVSTDPGGVTLGTTSDDAIAAFADVDLTMTVDEATADVFGVYFFDVSDGDARVFGGTVDPSTDTIESLATPFVPTCE